MKKKTAKKPQPVKRAAKPAAEPPRKISGGDKIPADIKAPGFGEVRGDSWVKPGRYHARGGAVVIVYKPITMRFGIQQRQTWQGWIGNLDGHTGEKITWGLDGKRSDATPAHEHDLLKRHKNQNYTCLGCGCVDARACPGGCSWVAPAHCSACFPAGVPT